MKPKIDYLVIHKTVYTKRPHYSWTLKNTEGGSFSMAGYRTLKACVESMRKSHPNTPAYIGEVGWNYDTDAAIEYALKPMRGNLAPRDFNPNDLFCK